VRREIDAAESGLTEIQPRDNIANMSPEDVLIREAIDSDIAQCSRLRADPELDDYETWHERFVSDLHNPDRRFFVAESNGAIVGYGHSVRHERALDARPDASPSGYFLSGLLVAPNRRRDGIGTRLTLARLEVLRNLTDVIYYMAEPSNEASINLHRRLGFVEVRPVIRDETRYLLFRLDVN
jgi:ribosomal protein S18 acetylase RimI-like enzyme